MKIGQPIDISVTTQSASNAAAQKATQSTSAVATATTTATQGARSAGVAVSVSTMARGLEKTDRNASADVDNQKVQAVRAAIQDGSYKVDAEAIADKLLANAQEMLPRLSR
jgi:negative regulator of flagellin synthesis FlgM